MENYIKLLQFTTLYDIIRIIIIVHIYTKYERKIDLADNDNVNEQSSDQFNSMLSAAQKQVGSSGGGNNGLTQAQIEAMLAVEDDDEEQPDEQSESESVGETEDGGEMQDEDASIADKLKEGIAADSQAAADETEAKKKKEKKPKVKKEKKPLDKAALAKMLTAAAVVVAAVLGYLVCIVFFSDVIKTPNEEFAIKAAKAVNSNIARGTEMYVYKAYVRNGAAADECMLYAIISSKRESGTEKTDMYRIVINHDSPNKINVYYTLDTESPEYIKMRDSDDEKLRIQASRLKSYSDDITAADREIQINSPEWHRIDCTVVNKGIMPEESN